MANTQHQKRADALQNRSVVGYSRFVRRVKLLIVSTIALMLVVMIVWPFINGGDDKYTLTFAEMEEQSGEKTEPALINPRFYGVDKNNKPYNLLADKAEETPDKTVYFTRLNTDIHLEDGTWVAIVADRGQLEANRRYLHLIGNVNILADSGYDIVTDRALVDLQDSGASGNMPVFVQTGAGNISADGFTLKERGDNIQFLGNVRTVRQDGLFDPRTVDERKKHHRSRLASAGEESTVELKKSPLSFLHATRPARQGEEHRAAKEEVASPALAGRDVEDFAWRSENNAKKPAEEAETASGDVGKPSTPVPHYRSPYLFFSKIPVPVLRDE